MRTYELIAAFPCALHNAKKGQRCNVRVACCSMRRTMAVTCPKCAQIAGDKCRNLAKGRSWQDWPPRPHAERVRAGLQLCPDTRR